MTAPSITTEFIPTIANELKVQPVQHGAVADVALRMQHAVGAGKRMDDAPVLHIRPGPDGDAAEVCAQAGERRDVAAGLHDDVTDQRGLRVDERGRADDRHHAVDLVRSHGGCLHAAG